ncbi:EAL domain-containing protein [uncultured Albimonas sp.]|uniref:sensor domain-containing protein n=1 Tax=uncultured Albimonas sp. TaxID=1331701 RepID=UPI0030EC33E5
MPDAAELFHALLGGAEVPALLAAADGRALAINVAFAHRLGRNADWRPARVDDLLDPDPALVAAHRDAVARALATRGREVLIEGAFRDAAGGSLRLACRISTVRLAESVNVLHLLAPAAFDTADRLTMLESMADEAPVALFDYRLNPDRSVSLPYFNAATPEIFGVSAERLAADGATLFSLVPAEDRKAIAETIAATSMSMQTGVERYRVNHPTRGLRHIIGEGTPRALPDGAVSWRCVAFDVTASHDAELRANAATEALAQAHERLARIALIAPVGLYEFRIDSAGAWSFPYLSPHMKELMGVTADGEAVTVETVFHRVFPEDLAGIAESTDRSARTLERWNRRFRLDHPRRGLIWLRGESVPSVDANGTVTWTGALYDVTEDVRREGELAAAHARADAMRAENERQALQDGLTGLPNRRAYDRAFGARIEAAREGSGPSDAILVRLDLDHFKTVNDTMGHEAGDRVLRQVAASLRNGLRQADFLARIGGDEFSILLAPGTTPEAAEELVARIHASLDEPVLHDGRPCRFGASFGIAHTEALGETGVELQVFADAALYRAKEGGRSRLEMFTPELHRGILTDRRLAVQIQDAIDRDEFTPFFQPQVRARDRGLHGAEVLLRWRHPHRGLLGPPDFLRVAEQLRLVPRIDRRLMERSREVLDRWAAAGFIAPRLSFNMSAGRIRDPDVVETSRLIGAGPTRIAMELLESTLVEEESDLFRFNLDRIREAGIAIEIDDFGSGHASIVGLTQVAPDALKIDRRLVAPVAENARSRKLIRAILEIAQTLGISTVAEGVETEAQARVLAELGCDVLQGYHFGAPMAEDDFLDFARAWPARVA